MALNLLPKRQIQRGPYMVRVTVYLCDTKENLDRGFKMHKIDVYGFSTAAQRSTAAFKNHHNNHRGT